MKSEVFNPSEKSPFPKLMVAYDGLVVLMTNNDVGTAVHQGKSAHEVGEHRKDWAMHHFTNFNGSVTLSNE